MLNTIIKQPTVSLKPLAHTPEAGINVLVDAAAYIFSLIGKLIELRSHHNPRQLHNELQKEIKAFRFSLTTLNYRTEFLSEYIPIATYLLCLTIDTIIGETTWGREGKWNKYRLINNKNNETLSRENFLIILERFIQHEEMFIDMLEFIYICLNLSFNYRSSILGFNIEQLQNIMHSLYKKINSHTKNFNKILSPYPFRQNLIYNNIQNVRKLAIPDKKNRSLISNSILSQEMMDLKISIKKFTHYLSNKFIKFENKNIYLNSLPWVLVTGSDGAGKATLLENLEIKYTANNKNINEKKQLSSNWNWYITPNAILIKAPAMSTFRKHNQNSFFNLYWQNMIDLIIAERGTTGLNSILFVVSLSEIMDKSKHPVLILQLLKKINILQNQFRKDLAFQLIISKCDLLTGFSEFFSDYTTEELFQPWGICLPQIVTSENLLESFYKPFDLLIKRINKQIIYRLHQERYMDPINKFYIKDFPLQLERLKMNLGEVLRKISKEIENFLLKGFYLTSATQSSFKDMSSQFPQNISPRELSNAVDGSIRHKRSYFIKHLLLNGISHQPMNSTSSTILAKHYFFDFLSKLTRGS